MMNNKKILGLITARGGSKGIPRKNIKMINGMPLIAHSIMAGLQSKYIDDVVVTTDDVEIARVSEEYGASVPFFRPNELSQDNSTSEAAILHAINWLEEKRNKYYDNFILLQPTSPLRNSKHVDEAIELFFSRSDVKTLYSVNRVKQTPFKMKLINEEGFMVSFTNEGKELKRRQDFPLLYHPNGAIYISAINRFKELKGFDEVNLIPYIMDEYHSADIDTQIDFLISEFLMQAKAEVCQ